MSDDIVDPLKRELSGLSGPARTYPLLRLGQALADRYWRAGPGSAAALPYLNGAIEALDEAYRYLDPADLLRGRVAAQLGWHLGARYTAHGGSGHDRDTGILLLEDALAFPDLPPTLRIIRLVLGQLYLGRATQGLQGPQVATALRSGSAPAGAGDADRAADCFHQVLADPPVSAEVTAMAQAMLATAEAMQTVHGRGGGVTSGPSGFGSGSGLGGFDLSRLTDAVTMLQKLQQQAGGQAGNGGYAAGVCGLPPMPWLFDADRIAGLDPLDRPVTVVRGAEPDAPARPPATRPAAARSDLAAIRRLLRDKLALACGSGTEEMGVYPAIASLLRPGAPLPDIHAIDEFVALASTVVDHEEALGSDSLLLAVALYLRGRNDGASGWAAEDNPGGDAQAAVESLLAAVATLPTDQPDTVPVVLRLAELLDADTALDRLAERYAEVTQTLRTVGAGGLVHPHPDGLVLLNAATGRLEPTDPLGSLPHRLFVVGSEPVEAGDSVVSYVSSGAQVVALARRTRLPITADPVFVANPRGDREAASVATMVLRRTFHPRSTGLGRTVEQVDGAGTPQDLLAHLDASLLHLDCGSTAGGALELAGPAELSPEQIAAAAPTDPAAGGPAAGGLAAGGLAILPPDCPGFVALAGALLAAGCTGVIGWLRPVPEPVAALMLFVLHARLVDDGLAPALAVYEVGRWMRTANRRPLPYLPAGYAATLDRIEPADPPHWTALVHRGI